MPSSVKEICKKIWDLEQRYGLLDRELQGVKVWQFIRMKIVYEITEKCGLFGNPHTVKDSLLDKAGALPRFLYNSVAHNPLFGQGKKKILVFDHPRKVLLDGQYTDIYTRYLLQELPNEEVLVLEEPYLTRHYMKPERNRKYLDYIRLLSFGLRHLYSLSFTRQELDWIKQLEYEINSLFGIKMNLKDSFLKAVKIFKIEYRLYEHLFKELCPEVIYVLVSYGRGAIIDAAHQYGIPIIEIQHGTISCYHMGYSFPGYEGRLAYFPDYLYVFGDYWADSVKLPLERNKIIPYGFPHLKELKKKYTSIVKKTKQLLFLSQGVIGKGLSQFAYQVALQLPQYDIIYKLHPGEYDRWQDEYQELKKASLLENFNVIDNGKYDLYELMAESQYQLGVYSTALYEGMAFSCRTILVSLPGIECMEYLIEGGFVQVIKNVNELQNVLTKDTSKAVNVNYFFKEFASEGIQ